MWEYVKSVILTELLSVCHITLPSIVFAVVVSL